jgi:hypothetical protein
VAGDFNAGKLTFYQHVKCANRGTKKLSTTFTPHTEMWTKLSLTLHLVNHNSILPIPAYKLKLKQEVPVTLSIRKWSDEADAKLQDCFARTDWNMFRDSFDGIKEYTTSVTGFINKSIDDGLYVVHTVPQPVNKCVDTPTRSHGLQATSALR